MWTAQRSLVPLRGHGFELRAFGEADLAQLRSAADDPDILRWNPFPESEDRTADLRGWLTYRNDWSGGDHMSWAVGAGEGELLGSVSLFHLDADQRDGEVGCWIAPGARGRRLASSAVEVAARFAYAVTGVHRLYLFHAVENAASCAVAGSCGFLLEGTLRRSYRYADGCYHDEHLHARLAGDLPPGGG